MGNRLQGRKQKARPLHDGQQEVTHYGATQTDGAHTKVNVCHCRQVPSTTLEEWNWVQMKLFVCREWIHFSCGHKDVDRKP